MLRFCFVCVHFYLFFSLGVFLCTLGSFSLEVFVCTFCFIVFCARLCIWILILSSSLVFSVLFFFIDFCARFVRLDCDLSSSERTRPTPGQRQCGICTPPASQPVPCGPTPIVMLYGSCTAPASQPIPVGPTPTVNARPCHFRTFSKKNPALLPSNSSPKTPVQY